MVTTLPDSAWRPRPQPLGRYWTGRLLTVPAIGGTLTGWAAHDLGLLDNIVDANWRLWVLSIYVVIAVAAPFGLVWSAVRR